MKRRAFDRSLRLKLAPRFHFGQTMPLAMLVLAAGLDAGAAGTPAAPATHIDLSAVANTDIEDDGIAGNGKGGWSDEGVNDMFIYSRTTCGPLHRHWRHINSRRRSSRMAT